MTDRNLTDLLERLGDQVQVSPPPLAAMTRAADRTRRRRTTGAVLAAAAAVAVVGVGIQVVHDGLADGPEPAAPEPAAPAGQVAVPDFTVNTDAQAFDEQLADLDLEMSTELRVDSGGEGRIVDVRPAPGTAVARGTDVTVVVSTPRPPEDRMVLGLAAYRPDGSPTGSRHTELTDAQIRNGATVRLRVGDTVWFHARGDTTGIYGADVDGTSLEVKHLPADDPYPRSATAVRAGTTTVRLTFTTGGKTIEIGSITFVVRP